MKKILIFVACLFFLSVGIVQAQTWYNVNQFTCVWDVVTTDSDGDPITWEGSMHYKVYIANADTDLSKANPVEVADVTVLEATVTLNTKGRYFVGVQSVWIYPDGGMQLSGINWADEIEYQEMVDLWAIRHHVSPKPPKNLTK